MNATHAINIALWGLLRPGDRVVTTGIEHNAVMRPLRALEKQGVQVTVVPCARDGALDLADMERALQAPARLVVVNHASNVMGTVLPLESIAQIAHRAGALVLVDAAQTAGVLSIDMQATQIDLLAFAGHKGLQGPPGTGGLVIGDAVNANSIKPLIFGGTGSRSEHETQPDDLPDKFESGTPNGVGIAGLGAGVRWVMERGVEAIRAHEIELTRSLVDGLRAIPNVTVYGPDDSAQRTATVSFTIADKSVSEIGLQLDEEFEVLCRVGLHCAPAAHRTLGTFPHGTVRLAPGMLTTPDEINTTLAAVERIAQT